MSQLFALPKVVPLSVGKVLPGARLYFYASGTSTPQDTYQDGDLATPHANPVVADAEGVFAPIYLDESLSYRVTLRTSEDALVYTVDTVNSQLTQTAVGLALYPRTSAEISAGVTPTNYAYPSGNALRYGMSTSATASANDTALARALLVSHEVLIPFEGDGIYDISASFTLGKWGQRVIGESVGNGLGTPSEGVVLNVVSGFPAAGGDSAQAVFNITDRYQEIAGLTIDCNGIALHGIYGTGGEVTHLYIHDVNIIEPDGDGVKFLDNTWMNRFDTVRVTTGAGWGFNFDAGPGAGHTTISLRNCYVSGTLSTGGFRFDAVSGFTMDACAVDHSPGWAIQMQTGSQGLVSGFNSEGTARLLDLSDVSSVRQRLAVIGGRFNAYGDDSTPPASVINNGGFLEFIGAEFQAGESATAFLVTGSNSVTVWKGNSLELWAQTNTISSGAYVDADNEIQVNANATASERAIIRANSNARFNLRQGTTLWEVRYGSSSMQMRHINSSYADNGTGLFFRADAAGRTFLVVPGPYADDAAASADAQVPVGSWYYDTNGFVRRRAS